MEQPAPCGKREQQPRSVIVNKGWIRINENVTLSKLQLALRENGYDIEAESPLALECFAIGPGKYSIESLNKSLQIQNFTIIKLNPNNIVIDERQFKALKKLTLLLELPDLLSGGEMKRFSELADLAALGEIEGLEELGELEKLRKL